MDKSRWGFWELDIIVQGTNAAFFLPSVTQRQSSRLLIGELGCRNSPGGLSVNSWWVGLTRLRGQGKRWSSVTGFKPPSEYIDIRLEAILVQRQVNPNAIEGNSQPSKIS